MKTLELNQMEQIEGGRKGWLAGWGCAITIAAFLSVGTATAGAGIPIVAVLAGGFGGSACVIGLAEIFV